MTSLPASLAQQPLEVELEHRNQNHITMAYDYREICNVRR